MDGWMDEWIDRWVDGWIDGWMDGWMDGWVDGWMDGWNGINGWISRMNVSFVSFCRPMTHLLMSQVLLPASSWCPWHKLLGV